MRNLIKGAGAIAGIIDSVVGAVAAANCRLRPLPAEPAQPGRRHHVTISINLTPASTVDDQGAMGGNDADSVA